MRKRLATASRFWRSSFRLSRRLQSSKRDTRSRSAALAEIELIYLSFSLRSASRPCKFGVTEKIRR